MHARSLTTTFVAVVALALATVAAAFTVIVVRESSYAREQRELSDVLRSTMELNQRLRADIDAQTALVYRYLDGPDPALADEYQEIHFDISSQQVQYLRMGVGDQERLHVANVRDLQEELARYGSLAMDAVSRGDTGATLEHVSSMEQVRSEVNATFEQLSALQAVRLNEALSRAEEAARDTYFILLGIVGALGSLLLAVTFLIRSRVQRPLADLLAAARRIRGGDLTARASERRLDEVGRTAKEFNFMARSLEESYASLENKVEERTAEIRGLQAQLVESERMSAIGQLVGGVAHELNNPMTAILGFAELERRERQQEGVAGNGGDAGDDDSPLDYIIHEAERCRRIVTDLLQFARQHETQLENVALNEVLERTLRLRDYEAETAGVRLDRDYEESGPVVYADPYKIEQVTLILVNNAIDAIHEIGPPGTVTVSTRINGASAILEVRDTGSGVKEPARVFEPFYTTKEVGKGTGLGLAVAYGIVNNLGGKIRVDNWKRGARFVIELPVAEGEPVAAPARPEARAPAPRTPAGTRLLVVDDERVLLRLQERLVADMGCEVVTAESGQRAIDLLEQEHFDAVVCDLRMPGDVDGTDVYDWLQEHRPELAGRFLFASGDVAQLEQSAAALGARCIRKPFSFADYREAIREMLGMPNS